MTQLDPNVLFRSTIGFDRLFDFVDSAFSGAETASFPPYNIEKTNENNYRIVMAVAGFGPEDIEIISQRNTLIIKGKTKKEKEEVKKDYLHKGIATRAFERRFQLADYIKVEDASLSHGMLAIDLKREIPEEMKPRTISIKVHEDSQKLPSSEE